MRSARHVSCVTLLARGPYELLCMRAEFFLVQAAVLFTFKIDAAANIPKLESS